MSNSKKILQGLGIPYSALLSVIFGIMIFSFPIGAYIVFNSEVGGDINFEYPLSELGVFVAGIGFEIPAAFELGDAFVVIWCIFAILFAIAVLGPNLNFLRSLVPLMADGTQINKNNYMVAITKWFAVLIIVSAGINVIQANFGIITEAPPADNELIRFYEISLAPLTEEIGFRVVLIGIPLFLAYSQRTSIKYFFKSLWNPKDNLYIENNKKAFALIIGVSVFFGAAHIISGEAWSIGKFLQAVAGGIILGWVYFRYGLVAAILIHWATNYVVYSYALIVSDINDVTIENAFTHPLMMTIESLLIVSGLVTIAVMLTNYVYQKRARQLEI